MYPECSSLTSSHEINTCNIMAEGFRFMPLGSVHGLLRGNINAGVHACGRSRRVTQRCHNSPKWETGLGSANDITNRKRTGDFEKVSRVEN